METVRSDWIEAQQHPNPLHLLNGFCAGNPNMIDLKWLGWILSSVAAARATAILAYSRVKLYLPSIAWSENIVEDYTEICFGFLTYIADRLLTGLDVKVWRLKSGMWKEVPRGDVSKGTAMVFIPLSNTLRRSIAHCHVDCSQIQHDRATCRLALPLNRTPFLWLASFQYRKNQHSEVWEIGQWGNVHVTAPFWWACISKFWCIHTQSRIVFRVWIVCSVAGASVLCKVWLQQILFGTITWFSKYYTRALDQVCKVRNRLRVWPFGGCSKFRLTWGMEKCWASPCWFLLCNLILPRDSTCPSVKRNGKLMYFPFKAGLSHRWAHTER